MTTYRILAIATAAAALTAFSACQGVDESAPSHPRTANFLTPDQKAKENAEHRELEPPKRVMPTGSGAEFPGQSAAPTSNPVITAADYGTPGSNLIGTLPHLQTLSLDAPATGTYAVPGVGYTVDNSWGQVLPLQEYRHRAWPTTTTQYLSPGVPHNPVYFTFASDKYPALRTGTVSADYKNSAVESPWFLAQLAYLPVNMARQCPWSLVISHAADTDPLYAGYLPSGGPVDPSPYPGTIAWTYSKSDATQPATQPQTTPGAGR